MTDPNIPAAFDTTTASLRAWLDARRAEIEHNHRDSWMGRDGSCYCDLPKPCPDRARELEAVDGLVAVLDERDDLRARLDTIGLLLPVLTATVTAPRRDAQSAELVVQAIAHHHAGADAAAQFSTPKEAS